MASNQNPKLEVPSNEAQTIRQEVIVQKLLNNDKNKPSDKSVPAPSSIINSSLINQVKAFMPQIKTANDELDKMENKSSVQIDLHEKEGAIDEDGKPYVEMNLQLYEENSGTSDSDSDSTNSTSSPSSSSSSDSEDDEEDDTVPSKQQKLITEIDE